VYLAEDEVYYEYFSHHVYRGATKGKEISMKAELHQVPVFVRGGSIVPTRECPRQLLPLMTLDPFTLCVALSKAGSACGELYLDDGVTYSHEKGQLMWHEFIVQTAKKTVQITTKDLGAEKEEVLRWRVITLLMCTWRQLRLCRWRRLWWRG
jgi:alpha 1,3-glucosidase